MDSADLAFYTTEQLIAELMRRRNFLGVVLHAEEDLRGEWRGEKTFKLHFNGNLDAIRAGRLLNTVAEYVDLHHS